jgi:hypothetical protein
MNYAKWKTYFAPGATEGFTPEREMAERGGFVEGVVALPDFAYIGYISEGIDLVGLDHYEITFLTADEALTLAQGINPDIFLDKNGKFDWPRIDWIAQASNQ